MNCRHCAHPLEHVFLDLGFAPPSNAYLSKADLIKPERYYPLKLFVCEHCWLVQTEDYAQADELFSHDYAYFSSISQSWLAHAARYTDMITKRLGLSKNSHVIEVAANDGYLLKNFVAAGIPCLGIEPTASTASAAEKLGIPILREFFGQTLAKRLVAEGKQADLILGNNVYAHVPDINDFTAGLKTVLKLGGTITLEFPHLMRLLEQTQFDTVYHEHFSYLSLYFVSQIFARAGLRVCDVEELPTHGGSLRVYGCHAEDGRVTAEAVSAVQAEEARRGMRSLATYQAFQLRADRVKDDLLLFLIEQKRAGKRVAAYGAAAKGCTLLNYAGVKPDLLPYVCDAAPSKQGKYLPGTHIPIVHPDMLRERKPDIVLILPWNIQAEVMQQMAYVREWGGKFAVAVPTVKVL
ncbi:MAG: methyltransferase domain-containing protein [Gammaproteobacteria bacterium]|nr:methyltransferase domain-containing protein [Gammaproteobacteria bacterium]